jgi:hypothetical protein
MTAQSKDPYQEPENSTVDDWFGQDAKRDAEIADKVAEEEGGNTEAAEQRFEQEADGERHQRARHDQSGPSGQ